MELNFPHFRERVKFIIITNSDRWIGGATEWQNKYKKMLEKFSSFVLRLISKSICIERKILDKDKEEKQGQKSSRRT